MKLQLLIWSRYLNLLGDKQKGVKNYGYLNYWSISFLYVYINYTLWKTKASVPQAEDAEAEASTGCFHPAEIALHGGTEWKEHFIKDKLNTALYQLIKDKLLRLMQVLTLLLRFLMGQGYLYPQ